MKTFIFITIFGCCGIAHATWHDFYMVTTGSDTNSGSTTDNQALYYSSSGTFASNGSGATNKYRFTAASGTPFSGASTGMYASVFLTTMTAIATTFIASITAVDASGTWVEVDTNTIKYGVVMSSNPTSIYSCKIGGAWASRLIIVGIFGSRVVPQSTRVNIQAGTYSNTSNTVTFGSSGGNGNLLWWRGYKKSPGDQDSNNVAVAGTDIPSFTFTTGEFSATGSNQIFSNMSVTSAFAGSSNGAVDAHNANLTFYRFRVVNSSNVANGQALVQNSAARNMLIQSSYIQASTAATNALQCNGTVECYVIGSVINGGILNIALNGLGSTLYNCKLYGSSSHAMTVGANGGIIVLNNDIYAPLGDGIRIAAAAADGNLILNNYFENVNQSNTVAIDLAVSSNAIHISGNAYFGCTANISTNILEGFAPYDNGTLTQAAFISPTNQNFSKLPVAQGIGFPSLFENLPNEPPSYIDVGANQHKGILGGGFSIAN